MGIIKPLRERVLRCEDESEPTWIKGTCSKLDRRIFALQQVQFAMVSFYLSSSMRPKSWRRRDSCLGCVAFNELSHILFLLNHQKAFRFIHLSITYEKNSFGFGHVCIDLYGFCRARHARRSNTNRDDI